MVFESRFKNIKDIPSAAMIGLEGEDIFIPRLGVETFISRHDYEVLRTTCYGFHFGGFGEPECDTKIDTRAEDVSPLREFGDHPVITEKQLGVAAMHSEERRTKEDKIIQASVWKYFFRHYFPGLRSSFLEMEMDSRVNTLMNEPVPCFINTNYDVDCETLAYDAGALIRSVIAAMLMETGIQGVDMDAFVGAPIQDIKARHWTFMAMATGKSCMTISLHSYERCGKYPGTVVAVIEMHSPGGDGKLVKKVDAASGVVHAAMPGLVMLVKEALSQRGI